VTILQTERLTLRPAREDDLGALHAVLSDPRATRYWSTPPHHTLDLTREWLASMIASPPGAGEDFVIEHQGRVIGKTGFYRFPDVGFILLPEMWGRGFGREALAAVLARAFTVHRLPQVTADVDPRNDASLGLLESFGFRRTGYRENSWLIGEEWCDSVDLALGAEEWQARA
jgi:RimJ/RimL family protein N-acetyltransferase